MTVKCSASPAEIWPPLRIVCQLTSQAQALPLPFPTTVRPKSSSYLIPAQNKKWGNMKCNKKCSFSMSLTYHPFAMIPLLRIQNKKAAYSWHVTINDVINLISQPSSKGIFILLHFFPLPHSFDVSKKDKRMVFIKLHESKEKYEAKYIVRTCHSPNMPRNTWIQLLTFLPDQRHNPHLIFKVIHIYQ